MWHNKTQMEDIVNKCLIRSALVCVFRPKTISLQIAVLVNILANEWPQKWAANENKAV